MNEGHRGLLRQRFSKERGDDSAARWNEATAVRGYEPEAMNDGHSGGDAEFFEKKTAAALHAGLR
jgi:hypothetical protein